MTEIADAELSRSGRQREIAPVNAEPSYTVDEFCALERISRSFYYKLRKAGAGPREISFGACKRITAQARAEWHQAREAA